MKHTFAVIVLAFTSSYTVSSEAGPSAFRCNYDLAIVGDSKVSVLQKCGEPVYKDSFCKPGSAQMICETVDEWTYNPGYGQFLTTLRFESEKLVSITYGDRVK